MGISFVYAQDVSEPLIKPMGAVALSDTGAVSTAIQDCVTVTFSLLFFFFNRTSYEIPEVLRESALS